MTQKLIAILLMPILVLGNSFAHSHGVPTQSSQGHERAHFHVGGSDHHWHHHHESHEHSGHKHDHDHESNDSPLAPATSSDHDSDAVYVAAPDYVFSVSNDNSLDFSSLAVVAPSLSWQAQTRPNIWRVLPGETSSVELPLYLLYAALRL